MLPLIREEESLMDRSRRTYRGRRVLVVGLGRSGIAAARHLIAAGARVEATDLRELERLGRDVAALRDAGVELHLGSHPEKTLLDAETIVLSPGVPAGTPGIEAARRAGVEVISEVDLAAPRVGERAVAITGSNGKSTVTALVSAMLAEAGFDALPCGNFGTPLIEAASGDHPGRRYSIELSSFQLETTSRLQATAAILLNVQADHLDRHGDFETYRAMKWRISELRAPLAPLVLNLDDPHSAALAASAPAPVLGVSLREEVDAAGTARDGWLALRTGGRELRLIEASRLMLPGRHNVLNALAAAVAVSTLGLDAEPIRAALSKFRPLPHRLQEVARVEGVSFIDDSKATNVASAVEAIFAVAPRAERLLVLLGGRDKDSDFAPLVDALEAARARAVTFGEAGSKIAATIREEMDDAGLLAGECGSLEEATRRAWSLARPRGAVLLSPACASFDAFDGYAARGEFFAAIAQDLASEDGP
jgi:UDP-N-acetylmuramoylalanine--D-glutamate ligase